MEMAWETTAKLKNILTNQPMKNWPMSDWLICFCLLRYTEQSPELQLLDTTCAELSISVSHQDWKKGGSFSAIPGIIRWHYRAEPLEPCQKLRLAFRNRTATLLTDCLCICQKSSLSSYPYPQSTSPWQWRTVSSVDGSLCLLGQIYPPFLSYRSPRLIWES